MLLENLTNEELLELHKKSNQKAFELFYGRTNKILFNFLVSKLKNRAEAEDALQETYIRIHRFVGKFDSNQRALSWAFKIAHNVSYDIFKKRIDSAEFIEEKIAGESRLDESIDAKNTLDSLLSSLKEEERDLIVSRYVEGESFADIAENKNLSEAGIRQQLSRLVRKIKLSKT